MIVRTNRRYPPDPKSRASCVPRVAVGTPCVVSPALQTWWRDLEENLNDGTEEMKY